MFGNAVNGPCKLNPPNADTIIPPSASMTVEIDFENDLEEEDLPSRLKIALPALREEFEDYLSEKVKEISTELEKSGYAEIDYRYEDETISQDLSEGENLYEKDGTRAMPEFEFETWRKEQGLKGQSAVVA